MIRIIAYQIAEDTNIKTFKVEYAGQLINSSSFELFYKYEEGYVFILNYGVVVFANVDDVQRSTFISLLTKYCTNHLKNRLQEDFIIEKKEIIQPEFSYNSLSVREINDDVIRIAMLQVAQSLALDYYQEAAQHLFDDTVNLTNQLEEYGKLKISKQNLMKFIGKTLNTKNRIIDNLYIYDTPAVVWEDELLGKVNDGLTKTFDISIRFKELEYMLKRVENNLSVFIELANAEESKRLEWIIIILIFIVILHLLLYRFFE
jgi:required for meiotic nuclear division protein 1